MVDMAVTLAMTVGPIISGTLHATVGYYYMNLTFGKLPTGPWFICTEN